MAQTVRVRHRFEPFSTVTGGAAEPEESKPSCQTAAANWDVDESRRLAGDCAKRICAAQPTSGTGGKPELVKACRKPCGCRRKRDRWQHNLSTVAQRLVVLLNNLAGQIYSSNRRLGSRSESDGRTVVVSALNKALRAGNVNANAIIIINNQSRQPVCVERFSALAQDQRIAAKYVGVR